MQKAKSQSITFKGKVYSNSSKNVIDASVVLKKDKIILEYNFTDAEGNYLITFNNTHFEEIIIEVNSLGYAPDSDTIHLSDIRTSYYQNFYLDEKIESLSEVILKSEEKIKINRDTISYRISAFKDNSERTVEDMLKKLPGIEVADDGTIRALGKPIQKILIEGDDLADTNYKVISKNLDVNVLEKIEIISNYDENPVLKQFLSSDNVVLNLKLKKDKKSVLFGKVEVGGGIENRFFGDINLGLMSPAIKFLDLANANNTGNPAEDQFGSYIYTPIGFNDFNKDFDIEQNPLVYLTGSTIELDRKNYIENTTFANNFLINKRFSDSLKLRNSFYFFNDSFEKKYSASYLYFVEPQNIFFAEQNSFGNNMLNLSNDLKVTFTPSQNTNITFANTLTLSNENYNNRLLFENERIAQNLDNHKREMEAQFQLSKKIKKGAAIIDVFAGSKNLGQKFHIKPNMFITDSINENISIFSNHDVTLDYQGLDANLIFKNDRTAYSFGGGFQHLGETIKTTAFSRFEGQNTPIDSLSGSNMAHGYISHLQFKLEQELYKDFFVYTNFDAIWNLYEKNDFHKTFFLPNPSAGIRINKTKTGSYRLNYLYTTVIPRLVYLTDNYFIKGYRNISLGATEPEALKSHNFFFNYTLARVEKRILINASVTHRKFVKQFGFRNFLSQGIDIAQTTYTPGQKLWLFQTGLTSYIDLIATSIKGGYQQQFSEQSVIINNRDTKLKSNTSQYYLTGTTYFKGNINFKFLANYTVNIGKNQDKKVQNERYKFQLETILNINKVIIAKLESKGFLIASQFYETNNVEIEFRPKGKNWALGLKVLNILNDKEYIFENSSEFIQTSTVFEAVPRYAVLYGRFRF